MAIIGNGVTISADGTGQLVVNVNGTNRLVYDFTNGTMAQSAKIYAQLSGGFGSDDATMGANYLDPCTVNNSNGTFTFTGNKFTCPRTGAYRMTAATLNRPNVQHWPAKNDAALHSGAHNTSSTAGYCTLSWSTIVYCNAGDTLSFRGNRNSGTFWGGSWSQYTIEYIG